ncbi:MAG TPA: phosphatidylserine decarboxylase [Gammaproteobacteria bacterium]|nr:phosphatidylserine decarboxylase [Gammaproteobacteria bacterium]|tara:strand:+ start:570 stop:1454 length:885 start_codon:yes stop_codon:yes gene_type:complete
MSYLDHLITLPQRIVPHHRLSRIAWGIAQNKNKLLKTLLIHLFLLRYKVDLDEADHSHLSDYKSFNDFFTRALRPGSRPLQGTAGTLLCPADGIISQLGRTANNRLVQAKGRYYSLDALLAGDDANSQRFNNGSFATIYLAPHNYHRVHAPITGTITQIRYVPGRLFSVNDRTARSVNQLFARNERLILEICSESETVIVILVGALLVASMELTCCDVKAAMRHADRPTEPYFIEPNAANSVIEQGMELGRFNMGSTVIILLEPETLTWEPLLAEGSPVKVGQALGSFNTSVLA